jgi:hypothetical protein
MRKEKGLMFYVKNKMASFKGVVLLEAPCGWTGGLFVNNTEVSGGKLRQKSSGVSTLPPPPPLLQVFQRGVNLCLEGIGGQEVGWKGCKGIRFQGSKKETRGRSYVDRQGCFFSEQMRKFGNTWDNLGVPGVVSWEQRFENRCGRFGAAKMIWGTREQAWEQLRWDDFRTDEETGNRWNDLRTRKGGQVRWEEWRTSDNFRFEENIQGTVEIINENGGNDDKGVVKYSMCWLFGTGHIIWGNLKIKKENNGKWWQNLRTCEKILEHVTQHMT